MTFGGRRAAIRIGFGLLLWGSLAWAEGAPGDWLEVDSAHFQLFTTASRAESEALLQHFEVVRSALLPAFGWAGRRERLVRIVAFRTAAEMLPYTPNERASGFFLGGGRNDFIVLATPNWTERTAAHEYGHLVLWQNGVELPAWLSEGLAEVHSNFVWSGARVVVGQFIDGRVWTLKTTGWVRLGELLAAGYDSRLFREASFSQSTYAQSWLLAHMLLLDPRYAPRFSSFLEAVRKTNGAEALRQVYGKSVEEVEADLHAYLSSGAKNQRAVEAGPVPEPCRVRVLPEASLAARLTLAEMLDQYPGKQSQAAAAFDQLEQDFPGEAEEVRALRSGTWRSPRSR